jgi:hypothetical protein
MPIPKLQSPYLFQSENILFFDEYKKEHEKYSMILICLFINSFFDELVFKNFSEDFSFNFSKLLHRNLVFEQMKCELSNKKWMKLHVGHFSSISNSKCCQTKFSSNFGCSISNKLWILLTHFFQNDQN